MLKSTINIINKSIELFPKKISDRVNPLLSSRVRILTELNFFIHKTN